MDDETLFTAANLLVQLGWLLLVFVPKWKYTRQVVLGGVVPIILSALYMYLILASWSDLDFSAFGSLAGLTAAFSNPSLVLVGWIHYLAFDLWVGTWEVRDAQDKGIPHLLVVPCLFFTLMLGPIGFLMYRLLRLIYAKKFLQEIR